MMRTDGGELLDALINDDDIANEIAADCHSRTHDNRWCSTCNSRGDGIDAYRTMLQQFMKERDAA